MFKLIILILIATLASSVFLKYYIQIENKYICINIILQLIGCCRSYSISKAIIFSLYSLLMLLIVRKDIKESIIDNKHLIYILCISIANFIISTPYIREQIIFGFLGGIVISIVLIVSERIFKREIVGGGDVKLIVAIGSTVGISNIFLLCLIATVIVYFLKKKNNPLAPGFLVTILFYI